LCRLHSANEISKNGAAAEVAAAVAAARLCMAHDVAPMPKAAIPATWVMNLRREVGDMFFVLRVNNRVVTVYKPGLNIPLCKNMHRIVSCGQTFSKPHDHVALCYSLWF
jgi:hypothetical protein